MTMEPFQYWLEVTLSSVPPVRAFMQTGWGWPAVESVHFLGLTLLFGSIAVWDMRLLGMVRGVPIAAFHRLVPFAVVGFAVNVASGSLFLMAEANQYLYNPAFHVKMLLVGLAGLNVLVFYVAIFRRLDRLGAGMATRAAQMSGAFSLIFWIGVIICGRLITFYRPTVCSPDRAAGLLADCILR